MKPKVSILIPAYNAGMWICETLSSAINQTWENKEIVVVDDGSSDSTYQKAKQFERGGVKIVRQENKGASAARNRAFVECQGEYIQWLDADDLLHPEKISKQMVAALEEDETVILSSLWGLFYDNYRKATLVNNGLSQNLQPVEWMLRKFNKNVWLHNAALLLSRKLLESAGPWNEELNYDDDGEYSCRVVSKCSRMLCVNEARSYYRIGNLSSLSHSMNRSAMESLYKSINLCIQHLIYIEDSARTRQACVNFINNNMGHYYPEQTELIARFKCLAEAMGGKLVPPEESARFRVLRQILGWHRAKRVKELHVRIRTMLMRKFETCSNPK